MAEALTNLVETYDINNQVNQYIDDDKGRMNDKVDIIQLTANALKQIKSQKLANDYK